ncbi:unnamed protein product [Fusarium venenatum]|uniref:Uncharacterized protein n=1 Tax=Fusarium venenatum TaxID=56646 RepID=A0A2L2U2M1_9HYPO|nr:uncharacterized protein FVRRES_08782 [Fusarium venenatum]CEI68705.1 unnamed protein product [Fusarium venenatum]
MKAIVFGNGTGERSFHPMLGLIALARRKRVKRQAQPHYYIGVQILICQSNAA